MSKKKDIVISFLPVTKMGKQKVVTIPRSIKKLQPGNVVLVIEFTPELLNLPEKVKLEWVDYSARRRFG